MWVLFFIYLDMSLEKNVIQKVMYLEGNKFFEQDYFSKGGFRGLNENVRIEEYRFNIFYWLFVR